jgi:F0F1-type ATP synthase beta subunit
MDMHLLRYIPKKIRPHVEDVFRDSDGIWVWGDDNFFDPSTGSHTVHVDTIAELRRDISGVKILPATDPRLLNS